ncbi:MAG: recombinase RecT [Sulfurihydrogenibium sp.]|nr:recombinase RecT [Sulfurihydrogenibium sp.]
MKIVKAEREEKNIIEAVRMMFPHLSSVSDSEIMKAVSIARHIGLDPIRKECHLVPFKGTVQVVVNYLEYIKRAERSGLLNGWSVQIGKDEIDTYAEVFIHRKDWQFPFQWKTYLSEVRKDTPTWRSMPLFMLKKACITQAFRLAFPEEVAMLPLEEAEAMAESVNETMTETVNETVKELPKETSTEDKEDKISEAQRKRLWAVANDTAKKHGLTKEVVETVIKSVLSEYGLEHTSNISKNDYDAIVEKIIKEIEEIAKEGGNEE